MAKSKKGESLNKRRSKDSSAAKKMTDASKEEEAASKVDTLSKVKIVDGLDELVAKARWKLLQQHPFWGSLVLNMEIIPKEAPWLPSATTDGNTIWYNPHFFSAFPEDKRLENIEFVLAHESAHCAFLHPERGKSKSNHDKWNIAVDYTVNSMLFDQEPALDFQDLPNFKIIRDTAGKYKEMTAEQIYKELSDKTIYIPWDVHIFGNGNDNGQDKEGNGEGMPVYKGDARKWARNVEKAAQIAKGQGKLPAGIERLIKLNRPKISWKKILYNFVDSYAKNDYNWKTPNRRGIAHGIYQPALRNPELGEIAFAADSSGSISEEQFSQFISELEGIRNAYSCKVHAFVCDAEVQSYKEFEPDESLKDIKLKGLGGCLLPNSRVFYYPRPEKVDTLPRDKIYGSSGRIQNIQVQEWLDYDGLAYKIKPRMLQEYNVTDEHPFWIVRYKKYVGRRIKNNSYDKPIFEGWVKAKDLRGNDCLVIPKFKDEGKTQYITLISNNANTRNKKLIIDSNVAEWMGWYMAEGCAGSDGNIILTLSSTKDPIPRIIQLIKYMGYSPYIKNKSDTDKAIDVGFKSHMLARWLRENIGTNSHNKRIPKEIFLSSNEIKKSFIRAITLGDGCKFQRSNRFEIMVMCTASEDLWYDLTYLITSLNVIPSTTTRPPTTRMIKRRKIRTGKAYIVHIAGNQQNKIFEDARITKNKKQYFFEEKDRFLIPIRTITNYRYKGKIFNVIPDDHTYLMPVITHNTDFRPVFRKIENLGIHPKVLVYVTDTYGTFPEKAPPYPVLWLVTAEGNKNNCPFGTVVSFDDV